jgi:uncharacterized protein (TIGR03437 family)
MQRERKIFWAKTGVIFCGIPLLVWAYAAGPDAGKAGVPGESTCNEAGCHVGTPLNGGGGSVSVAFPAGQTYTPGVKQHVVVTISDARQRRWGFQLTARLANDAKTQAGTFAPTDQFTQLMCASTNLAQQNIFQACPANMPLQYIEHTLAGSSRLSAGSGTYEFDWTPPATDVGDVIIYVAGNAANGNSNNDGDHIYTAKYTLSAASGSTGGSTPAIQPNGVVTASSFGAFPSIAPGTWVEIYGTNLSSTTRQWAGTDFSGVNAPTGLDDVKVTIGGQQAYIDFISAGQVNAQIPSNIPAGQQQITVTNAAGTSTAYTITVNDTQPGLLAPPSFNIGGKQYVVAQHADNSFVLPSGAISGLTTTPAKPGETVVIYGIGFGPAKDTSNSLIPAGQIVTGANQLTGSLQMQVNGVTAPLSYFGLAPNFVGLYQFNLVVPAVPDGDWPLTFTLNGNKGTQTLFLPVHQ